ncbi:MAG: lipoprotein signal peptidase [Burkholderiales bacterium]|nr:lipoprotein signal peptidase [Burkholderiales bacterium]
MWRWLLLAGLVVAIDQGTKHAAVAALAGQPPVEVTSFFNLVLVYNRGAAFSFLAGADGWQRELFTVIALAASAWIIWLLYRYPRQRLFCLALALVLGGALGNVIDRITIGAVVDFLDFHAGGWHWPAFNAADSAITCGAVLLVWDGLRGNTAADKS